MNHHAISRKTKEGGQALVVLLVFVIMAMTLISAAVSVVLINSQAASSVEQGEMARAAADSGIEEALLRLVRDPGYAGGILTVGTGSVTVGVSGINPKTVMAQGRWGTYVRTQQAVVNVANNQVTALSWQEVH
ncbi:MAG: hypothetical protein AAB803_02885 [Patescibacteria group bacterium]